jgi:hypothetical protein
MEFKVIFVIFSIQLGLVLSGGNSEESPAPPSGDSIYPGQCLEVNQEIISANGQWALTLTPAALIVVNKTTGEQTIKFNARRNPFQRACIDEYGNFVIYGVDGNMIVRFEQFKPGGNARITNDGELVLEKDGVINLVI